MKKVALLFLPLLFIALCACSAKLTQGEVSKKEFVPKHTETVLIAQIFTDGENIQTIFVPFVYFYDDTYKITIRAYDENKEENTATYRVKKEIYDKVDIGDEFIYQKDFEPDYPEYTREKQEE